MTEMPKLVREPSRHVFTQIFDSSRWAPFQPRPDDIIVSTYPKCGTTWTQRIIHLLITQDPAPTPINSPWYDMRLLPVDPHVEAEAVIGRRHLKAHLPYDALPIYDQVKIIHVARDGRDSAMSLFNHLHSFTPLAHGLIAQINQDGPFATMPSLPKGGPGAFFTEWLDDSGGARGDVGAGFWHMENSFWNERRNPNVLLVHFNDLKQDRDAEMRRIAHFLEIPIDEARWPALVEAASFETMKRDAPLLLPVADFMWEGGGRTFINKGTNGRWQECASEADLARYDSEVKRHFSPALARWLEAGRLVAGDPAMSPD